MWQTIHGPACRDFPEKFPERDDIIRGSASLLEPANEIMMIDVIEVTKARAVSVNNIVEEKLCYGVQLNSSTKEPSVFRGEDALLRLKCAVIFLQRVHR